MKAIRIIWIVLILLAVELSSAQDGISVPQAPPQVEITRLDLDPPTALTARVHISRISFPCIVFVTLTDHRKGETKFRAVLFTPSPRHSSADLSIRFGPDSFSDDNLYLVEVTLLDRDTYHELTESVSRSVGNEQLEPAISKVTLIPQPGGLNQVTVNVEGTKSSSVTKVHFRLTTSAVENIYEGFIDLSSLQYPMFNSFSSLFVLPNLSSNNIKVVTTLEDDAQKIYGTSIENIPNPEPYLKIDSIKYNPTTNLVEVNYNAARVTTITFAVNDTASIHNQPPSPPPNALNSSQASNAPSALITQTINLPSNESVHDQLPLQPAVIPNPPPPPDAPDSLITSAISLSVDNLFPNIAYTLTAIGTGDNSGSQITIKDSLDFTYSPPINWLLAKLISSYWYLIVIVIALLSVLILRQYLWLAHVGSAPLAVLPVQRHQAIKHLSRRWEDVQNLSQFYVLIGHPDSQSYAAAMITRARQLSILPEGFSKLTTYVDTLKDIKLHRNANRRLSPIKHHEEAILDRLSELLIKDCSELVKAYWEVDRVCRRPHIPPITIPEEDINLSKAGPYLELLRDSTRQLQEDLQVYATLFDQPNLHEAYLYLSEILGELNRLRSTKITDDVLDAFVTLDRIYERLNGYLTTIRNQEDMIKPDLSGLMTNSNPIHLALVEVRGGFRTARRFFIQYAAKVKHQILVGLQKVQTIENIAELEIFRDSIIGNHFGGFLDVSLDKTADIAQEVSSAMSQSPQSYGRRLALQDAHVLIRDLYAVLKNEEPELAEEVQRITLLFEERKREEQETEQHTYDNPYVTGNPIRPERVALFKGRELLAADVVNRLRGGRSKSTLLLYGARRMGKSSFLYHLENLLPTVYLSVFIDCQGSATDSEANFFYKISRAIHDVLRKRELSAGRNLPRPHADQYKTENPALILEEWLRDEVAPILNDHLLLITLDEFEEIGNAIKDGRINPAILGQFRHMIQHNDYINFMFAGVATLDALVPNAASYFISVSSIELSYLDNAAAESLIRYPYQLEDKTVALPEGEIGHVPLYDDNAVSRIMYLTHNQPYLIQAMCEQLINIANNEQLGMITQAKVEQIAKTLDREYPNYFEFYWKNWGELGQKILFNLTHGNLYLGDIEGKTQEIIAEMLRHRIIYKHAEGGYKIEIPLMEKFLEKRV